MPPLPILDTANCSILDEPAAVAHSLWSSTVSDIYVAGPNNFSFLNRIHTVVLYPLWAAIKALFRGLLVNSIICPPSSQLDPQLKPTRARNAKSVIYRFALYSARSEIHNHSIDVYSIQLALQTTNPTLSDDRVSKEFKS